MTDRKNYIKEAWDAYCKVKRECFGHGDYRDVEFMDRNTFMEAVRAIDTARRYDLEIKTPEEDEHEHQ